MSAQYIDCADCNRGGNGYDKDKCSCGWQIKRHKRGGCFLGEPIKRAEADAPKQKGGGE